MNLHSTDLHAVSSSEQARNRRRDRKRTTKMVVDNGGVRKLQAVVKRERPKVRR